MTQEPGAVFEATYECGVSGLAGTMEVAINDNQNNVVFGPTALNIVELTVGGTPTGSYRAMLTAPADEGQFTIVWSNDGSFIPANGIGEEDLLVEHISISLPPIGAGVADSVLCNAWTTAQEVVECCDAPIGSDTSFLEAAIVAASELLYEASGRQFPGVCTRTVRPCKTDNCLCGGQVLSRGHLIGWDWKDCFWGGYDCGCRPLSSIKLAGRVREITEVLVDGIVVDPSEYYLLQGRYLIHRHGARWPRCQSLDLADDEPGTFAVTYTYGKVPPVSGQLATQQLACEIVKSCTPGVECALPNGVVQITRQGITIQRGFFVRQRVGVRPGDVVWATGLGSVDYFLNGVNPRGLQRRGVFWSPSSRARYARPNPT